LIAFEPTEPAGVALVRRLFDAFGRRDLGSLVELVDPEIELFAPTAVVANEGRCYRGHEGLARYLHDVERVWARLEVIPEKFREVGNHVVALGRVRAEARDGLEVESPTAWVWELRRGRVCWGCVYSDPGETFMGLQTGSDGAVPAAGRPRDEPTPPLRAA
jgi:ketosteroid isomerase-like protein